MNNELKYSLEGKIEGDEISITTYRVVQGHAERLGMEIMKTKDRITRAALIEMGWTPPAEHVLYKDGDANIPNALLDRNGRVALSGCKNCGRAEIELEHPCTSKPDQAVGEVPDALTEGSVWCHRNGIPYRVLFLANVNHATPMHLPFVVYECVANGNKYVRPVSDWARSFTLFPEFTQPKPEQAVGDGVVAYVPVHPRTGPLWMDTYGADTKPDRARYPAMPLYGAPRPAVATPAEVTDQAADAAFDDGEQVAQWLYSKGMRNAAFVVRGQLDVRNNRIRKLEAALASPSAGAVVPDRITAYEAKKRGWLKGPKSYAAGWNACLDALAAAPEVPGHG